MTYSADLIRFISAVPVLNDGTIPLNTINNNNGFVSKLYEPTYSLSVLARLTQSVLTSDTIEVDTAALGEDTIVSMALNSDLSSYAPDIYLLLRAVVLESFSLLYNIEKDPSNLQYVSAKDIQNSMTNLSYIADYMSTEPKYFSMIEKLRDMNISFGYLENQIGVIMIERGGR
ncbi:hypothetical protein BSP38_095 [Bacillus phage BSP38]|uniref:Uncharacterized protein n=1 Tax=Bacillus phage BSP38 TaxID=2283013 RepID=A0A345MJV5_BPBSP|nr:hypothetical protein HWB82_gp223 [Bacillus phage BSP38]AXH71137.1 hypothetical protein BSP38_095 [Bacillus phage BSP38]